MNKNKRLSFWVFIASATCIMPSSLMAQFSKPGLTQYVNPFIGTYPLTDSVVLGYRLPEGWRSWAGLTFPGSSLPNAMIQLSPITEYGSGAGYEYEDNIIYGFTHTNKGHWNLCNIPVLPLSGNTTTHAPFRSQFTHERESAAPAFYQVYLDDYEVNVTLTSTLRCGYHRYEFKNKNNRKILFDLAKANDRISDWKIEQVDSFLVQGYQQAGGERIYFFAVVSNAIRRLEKIEEGKANGFALMHLSDVKDEVIELKIALSFVSAKNAKQTSSRK